MKDSNDNLTVDFVTDSYHESHEYYKSVMFQNIIKEIVCSKISKTDIRVLYQILLNINYNNSESAVIEFSVNQTELAKQLSMALPNVSRSIKNLSTIIEKSGNKYKIKI